MNDLIKEPLCILAPNPSPLTGPGTNSFLLGNKHVAVVDPGPDDPNHLDAIVSAGRGNITHIFVTHAHRDHSAGARRLADMTGASVLAFGGALAGRSPVMQRLAASGFVGGGEGLDMEFQPDILLTDNQIITTPEWSIRAVHTPGHSGSHMCYHWCDILFCGDIILGWSSTLISPPDGDLNDFFRSMEVISAVGATQLLPAHGDPVDAPPARIAELVRHRRQRTAEIMAALGKSPDNATGLAVRIYDVPDALLPAASRNVFAHLIAMFSLGAVTCDGEPTVDAIFKLSI